MVPPNDINSGIAQQKLFEAVAFSGKTTFTLHWLTVHYALDMRSGPVQDLKSFPAH
jgi:hypothetical protein